ncbi:MAG: UTP--glucose-1-phosphate uridylyltransferase [Alphaproteobacteria bacterium]|nr:UTP--glucose-1-phosphate uridylyltransferase [Alphaproteobacteria bacterium]
MAGAVRKAIFPVAGLGTRFLPATRAVPKEMLAIVDRPLIDYAIAEAQAAGIETFIFVTGLKANADSLRAHLNLPDDRRAALAAKSTELERAMAAADLPAGAAQFVTQEQPLGLGHAVWCARELVGDEPFAVLLPDDLMVGDTPAIGQLIEAHGKTGGNIVAVEEVPRAETARYGVLDPGDSDGPLTVVNGLVEKPAPEDAPSTLSVIGRYVLLPDVFAELGKFEKGAGGEIQLTDAMARTIGRVPFHGLKTTCRRFDCGAKGGFIAAQIALAMKDPGMRAAILDQVRREGGEWE